MTTTISFRQELFYDGPDDDDRVNVVIRILNDNGPPLAANALIDTGAEDCIFDMEYANLLGLDVPDGERFTIQTADNQEATAYRHLLKVEFLGHGFDVPVGFVPEWADRRIDNLLGTKGFLDQMVLGLDHSSRTLYVTASPATT